MKPPKTRFLKNEAAAKWMRDVVVNPFFVEACEATMLSLTFRLTENPDAAEPNSRFLRLTGAREFLTELFQIAEPPKDHTRQPINDNLIHTT